MTKIMPIKIAWNFTIPFSNEIVELVAKVETTKIIILEKSYEN